jgi:hypothetical protein
MTVVHFPAGAMKAIFSLRHGVQTGSGATQSPIQRVPRALSPRVKWVEREATTHLHLVPRVRTRGAIPRLPSTSSWRGA